MMNFPAEDLAARIRGIQAITLGQEILQRSRSRLEDFADGAIVRLQDAGPSAAMRSLAGVVNPAVAIFALHGGPKIRQMKPGPGDRNCYGVLRVQAEEPDARF